MEQHPERKIGAAEFKAKCLQLLKELGPEGLVVTSHGRPVARVLPYEPTLGRFVGSMAGEIAIDGEILGTGVSWDAAGE
jgi:prevent-host-death family protein